MVTKYIFLISVKNITDFSKVFVDGWQNLAKTI